MKTGRFRLNEAVRVVLLTGPGSDRGAISTIPADSVIEVQGHARLCHMVEATWNNQSFAVFECDLAERVKPDPAIAD
jgi:hypothetical protein